MNRQSPSKDQFIECLGQLHSSLSRAGIEYYLFGGFLLGLIRSGEPIPGDDDIDIAVLYQGRTHAFFVRKVLEKAGFQYRIALEDSNKEGLKFELRYNDVVNIEINFLYPYSGAFRWYALYQFISDTEMTVNVFRDPVIDAVEKSFGNLAVNVPKDPEAFLEYYYGKNWRIPKPDWHFLRDATNLLMQYKLPRKII